MDALADKIHKQEVPCTQWYALHTMATLFNNHPYISTSGMPVGNKFTNVIIKFTNVALLVCVLVCQCIHWTFPTCTWLDFFLNIFFVETLYMYQWRIWLVHVYHSLIMHSLQMCGTGCVYHLAVLHVHHTLSAVVLCSITLLCLGAHALKAYGSQFVCHSVILYVCNSVFSEIAINQALKSTVWAQHDNISNLIGFVF